MENGNILSSRGDLVNCHNRKGLAEGAVATERFIGQPVVPNETGCGGIASPASRAGIGKRVAVCAIDSRTALGWASGHRIVGCAAETPMKSEFPQCANVGVVGAGVAIDLMVVADEIVDKERVLAVGFGTVS